MLAFFRWEWYDKNVLAKAREHYAYENLPGKIEKNNYIYIGTGNGSHERSTGRGAGGNDDKYDRGKEIGYNDG